MINIKSKLTVLALVLSLCGCGKNSTNDVIAEDTDKTAQKNVNEVDKESQESELETRNRINSDTWALFLKEDFAALDAMANTYRESQKRTSSGLWKLTIFYDSFNYVINDPENGMTSLELYQQKLDKWLTENPKSPTANILKGEGLLQHAWNFQDDSLSQDEAMKIFHDNVKIANQYMESVKDIASHDPHWYITSTRIKKRLSSSTKIEKALGISNKEFNNFIDEGLTKHPYYYQLYFEAIDFLGPRWHGSASEIEKFANEAVARTKEKEAMAMYARIYWFASQVQYDERLFLDSDVVWDNMSTGMLDVIEQYPDSWNIQNFAYFSCIVEDKEMTKKLFDMIHDPMIIEAWKTESDYQDCKTFAYQPSTSTDEDTP